MIWHVYPLGVLGADQTGADRTCRNSLRDLAAWLPHVSSLGAGTVMLGPIFRSLSHGYDTVTHLEIDDRLGTLADFDALIAAAASHDIGVVLDGAFAYASREFWQPAFLRHQVPWRVDSLVTPDYESDGYRSYVAEVMSFWLDRGVQGWRLDSSWSVPAGFWREVLARVRRSHPDAWFLGQVFDDDLPPVINSATYSSATEYALMHGTREWLSDGDADRMAATLRVHQRNSSRNPVHTFLGNHDVARLADVIDPDLLPMAFTILMTLPGIPGVYYGDELGLTSTWTQGGSDALLRPAMSVPGQSAAPGRDVAGRDVTPGRGVVPGQVAVPGRGVVPGQVAVPGRGVAPGQVAVPGRGVVPGQVAVPGRDVVPGQVAVPGRDDVPGQGSAPARRPAPGLLEVVRELGAFRRENAWLTSAALADIRAHDGVLSYRVSAGDRSLHVTADPAAKEVAVAESPRLTQ